MVLLYTKVPRSLLVCFYFMTNFWKIIFEKEDQVPDVNIAFAVKRAIKKPRNVTVPSSNVWAQGSTSTRNVLSGCRCSVAIFMVENPRRVQRRWCIFCPAVLLVINTVCIGILRSVSANNSESPFVRQASEGAQFLPSEPLDTVAINNLESLALMRKDTGSSIKWLTSRPS